MVSYVLIIVAFVAMGGPKDTTPTIDHIPFQSKAGCEAAKDMLLHTLAKQHPVAKCLQQ